MIKSELFWLAFGLSVRAGLALVLEPRFYQAEEDGYWSAAQGLVQHGVLGEKGLARVMSPMAPCFFSLFDALRSARMAQALVSTLTAWMIGRMTADLTGSKRAGLFALASACVYPFYAYYSGLLVTETLYLALLTAGSWLACRSLKKTASNWAAAGAGFLLALAGLTRTEAVPIAFGLWCLLLLRGLRWQSLVLALLCWALPLGGWLCRNYGVVGAFTLDTHGGVTLLHGTMFFDADRIDASASRQAIDLHPVLSQAKNLKELDRDRFYKRVAMSFMRENPWTTARQWLQKAADFWRFYPRLDPGGGRWGLVALSLLFEPALICLGLWGAWRLRDLARSLWPLYWIVFSTFVVHVAAVSQMRHRLPVTPVLMLFACAWLDKRLARRERP
ncbi:MAG: glycosyltransferase family 39 protein [Elusimicrobiota bacterium]